MCMASLISSTECTRVYLLRSRLLSLTFADQPGPLSRHHPDRYYCVSPPHLYLYNPPGLWLRHCTSQIFNLCRLPQHPSDTLTVPAPPSSPWASTVTVLAHDYYYALRVADPTTGAPLHVDEIERGMRAVVTDVHHRRRNAELPVQVGVLTAHDRDEWSLVGLYVSLFIIIA